MIGLYYASKYADIGAWWRFEYFALLFVISQYWVYTVHYIISLWVYTVNYIFLSV